MATTPSLTHSSMTHIRIHAHIHTHKHSYTLTTYGKGIIDHRLPKWIIIERLRHGGWLSCCCCLSRFCDVNLRYFATRRTEWADATRSRVACKNNRCRAAGVMLPSVWGAHEWALLRWKRAEADTQTDGEMCADWGGRRGVGDWGCAGVDVGPCVCECVLVERTLVRLRR